MERTKHSLNSGVYQIVSKRSDRVYIGSAVDFRKRKNEHFNNLRTNIHENPRLQNHFNKYGEDDLSFVVIERCVRKDCLIREQFYLDNLKPFFNISKNASAPMEGRKHSEETLIKMGVAVKKRWQDPEYRRAREEYSHSEETLKKMHDTHIGKKQPQYEVERKKVRVKNAWQDPEYRKKHIESMKGIKKTEEHNKKNSDAQKKWWDDPENRKRQSESRKLSWALRKQNKVA